MLHHFRQDKKRSLCGDLRVIYRIVSQWQAVQKSKFFFHNTSGNWTRDSAFARREPYRYDNGLTWIWFKTVGICLAPWWLGSPYWLTLIDYRIDVRAHWMTRTDYRIDVRAHWMTRTDYQIDVRAHWMTRIDCPLPYIRFFSSFRSWKKWGRWGRWGGGFNNTFKRPKRTSIGLLLPYASSASSASLLNITKITTISN